MMAELIGSITILIGAVFLFSAGLGMLRMPYAFTQFKWVRRPPRSATRWCWWGSPSTIPTGA